MIPRGLALFLLVAGCASDPCDGKSGVCVSLRVQGHTPALDQIDVAVANGGALLDGETGPKGGHFSLPVRFAILLPSTVSGAVELDVKGLAGGFTLAEGKTSVKVSGHASATVTLEPVAGDDGGVADLSRELPDGADLHGPSDLSGIVFLTPDPLAFPVVSPTASADSTITLVNNTSAAVTPSAWNIPSTTPFSIENPGMEGAGTCSLGTPVPPGGSCTIDVRFAPTASGKYLTAITVGVDGGTLSATVKGRSASWVVEQFVAGGPYVQDLVAVGGASPTSVWACGNGQGTGKIILNSSTDWANAYILPADCNGIFVPTSQYVYAISGSSVHQYATAGGSLKTATPSPAPTGTFRGIWGTSDHDLYVASDKGEVYQVDFPSFTPIRAADTHAFASIGGDNGTLIAVAPGTVSQYSSSAWSDIASGFGTPLNRVWVGGSDWFAAATNNGLFAVAHGQLSSATVDTFNSTAGAAWGVWGLGPDDVYAVGTGGMIAHSTSTAGAGTWTLERSNVTTTLRSIWGTGDELWAVGDQVTVVHFH